MNSTKTNSLKRRAVLVARDLSKYSIYIAALSVTSLEDKSQLTGFIFWNVWSSIKLHEAGVGLAIISSWSSKLTSLCNGLNDSLMSSWRLPFKGKCHATTISAYVLIMTNPEEVKDKFYEDFGALTAAVSKADKLVVLGDFNAIVESDYET